MAVKKTKKEIDAEENNESSTGSKPSLKESLKALQLVKNKLKKKMDLNDTTEVKEYEVVSTGSATIDEASGIGGLATGRCYLLYGLESSGKSSICYSIVHQFQKAYPEKFVAYVDAEQAVSIPYMQQFGVNLDALDFQQPTTAEEALTIIDEYAASGAVSLIILDSIASMLTKAQLERDIDQKTMGSLPGVLGVALTRIKNTCKANNVTLVMVNQVRDKITMFGGGGFSLPGGHAPRFYSSMMIEIKKRDIVTENDVAVGQTMQCSFKKNKLGTPYAICETKLIFGKGFDFQSEYFDIAVDKGIINKSGAWYDWTSLDGSSVKFQGKINSVVYLKNDPKEFDYLKTLVKNSGGANIVTLSKEEQLLLEQEEENLAEE